MQCSDGQSCSSLSVVELSLPASPGFVKLFSSFNVTVNMSIQGGRAPRSLGLKGLFQWAILETNHAVFFSSVPGASGKLYSVSMETAPTDL